MESIFDESSSTPDKPKQKSYSGYIITGTLAGIVFGIHLIAGPFITPALRRVCLPFVPASEEQVENVFRMLKGRKGKFIDLGSGDGRLVREAAKRGIVFGIHLIAGPFITPALRRVCLPFVPASEEQVENVFRMLKGRKGKFIDLGSGDGRLVREAAKRGFTAHGVEMNIWLVLYSKFKAAREGLSSKTKFTRTDLWKHNLQQYDNIVIFGVQSMMKELEKKIIAESKDDVRVVACRFPLPNIEPEAEIGTGVDTVWLYKIPKT